jgi:hypothetical protein
VSENRSAIIVEGNPTGSDLVLIQNLGGLGLNLPHPSAYMAAKMLRHYVSKRVAFAVVQISMRNLQKFRKK